MFGLIGLDWKTFVIDWAIGQDHVSNAGAVFASVLFTVIVVLLAASYLRCIFTSSAVSDNPAPAGYFQQLQQQFPDRPLRVCAKCNGAPKPFRAHHCSLCDK